MRFKFLILNASLMGLVGCSFFMDEVKRDTEVNYKEKAGSCVTRANDMLKTYFDTNRVLKIDDQLIDNFATCYQDTLASVIKNTKSGRANPNEYIPENIDGLVETLHDDISIGLDNLQFLFQLKAFLLGGKPGTLTKDEMRAIQKLLPSVASSLKAFNPYRALLFGQGEIARDESSYEQFGNVFETFETHISGLLVQLGSYQRASRKIDIRKLAEFVFTKFLGQEKEVASGNLDLLVSFKNLSLNSEGNLLSSEDLRLFAKQSLRVYKSLTTYSRFIEDGSVFTNLGHILSFVTQVPAQLEDSKIFTTVTLSAVQDVVNSGAEMLIDSSQISEKNLIQYSKFHSFLLNLDRAGFMTGRLRATTLSQFLYDFSEIWLGPGQAKTPDLTPYKARYVRGLIAKWSDRQRGINGLFAPDYRQEISLDQSIKFSEGGPVAAFWSTLYQKVSVYHWDDLLRVQYKKDLTGLSFEEMTASNSIALMVELFTSPFNAGEKNFLNHNVTISQAQDVYEVVRILGIELAFMDSRVLDSGRRSFGETNNFSTQLRNNDKMDFYESYEYLAVALSSGRLSDRIHSGIDDGYHLIHKDVIHRLVTDMSYFRSYLAENFEDFFGHFTAVTHFWREASDRERRKLIQVLEIASRAGVISDKPIDLGEIRSLSTILSYVEATFYNFDRNRDGYAKGEELIEAREHFRRLLTEFIVKSTGSLLIENKDRILGYMHPEASDKKIKELGKESDVVIKMADWLAPKIFIYLLRNGSIPKKVNLRLASLFNKSVEAYAYRSAEANVLDVLLVFSTLAEVTRSGHINSLSDFLEKQFNDSPSLGLVAEIDSNQMPECLSRADRELRRSVEPQFCQFARLLFCNETVNEELYTELTRNRYTYFPRDEWDKRNTVASDQKKEVIKSVLAALEVRLRDENHLFTFQCAFPQLEAK